MNLLNKFAWLFWGLGGIFYFRNYRIPKLEFLNLNSQVLCHPPVKLGDDSCLKFHIVGDDIVGNSRIPNKILEFLSKKYPLTPKKPKSAIKTSS